MLKTLSETRELLRVIARTDTFLSREIVDYLRVGTVNNRQTVNLETPLAFMIYY